MNERKKKMHWSKSKEKWYQVNVLLYQKMKKKNRIQTNLFIRGLFVSTTTKKLRSKNRWLSKKKKRKWTFPHPYANSRFRKIAGFRKVENRKNKVQHRKVKIKITFKNSKILQNYLKAFKIQSDVDFGMLMIFKNSYKQPLESETVNDLTATPCMIHIMIHIIWYIQF